MTYAADFGPIDLGVADTGLTLTADIETMAGVSLATGATGWTEKPAGSGVYWGTYSSFADGVSYKVLFYSGATFKASVGVSPSMARTPVDSAAIAALAASLVTLAGYVDTEVAAIKARTDLIGTGSLAIVGSVVQSSGSGVMPGKHNLTIQQGASFSRVLTWKDALGAPINLTGYTARMQIRAAVGSSATLLELTTTNGRLTLGGVAGTITMTLTAVETAILDWAVAPYSLEMVSGATVTPLLAGYVTLRKEVTR